MVIILSETIQSACYAFGHKVCLSYAFGKKETSRNMYVEGKPKIDQNRDIQTAGRMAEVAVCQLLDLPINNLNWDDKCDRGYDLITPYGATIDVKCSTHPRARKLIWPVSKNHFLDKAAKILVFCRVHLSTGTVEIVGWVPRDKFIQEAETAVGVKGLVDGTRFMDQDKLFEPKTIIGRL